MRAVSRATWTSVEPVSLSPRLCSSMILPVSMDIAGIPSGDAWTAGTPMPLAWRAPREPPLAVGHAPGRPTRAPGMAGKSPRIVARRGLAGQGAAAAARGRLRAGPGEHAPRAQPAPAVGQAQAQHAAVGAEQRHLAFRHRGALHALPVGQAGRRGAVHLGPRPG